MSAPGALELGQTQDPKELVPGDVAVIDRHVSVLKTQGSRLDDTAGTVGAIRTAHWSGPAADAFEGELSQLPKAWRKLAGVLDDMQSALTTYAGALTAAQGKAADAIAKWNQGQAATQRAVVDFNAKVERYNAERRQLDANPFAPPPQWSDPGAALREEAQQLLRDARESVESAGNTASRSIGNLPGVRTTGASGPDVDGKFTDPLQLDFTIGEHGHGPRFHDPLHPDSGGHGWRDKTKVTIAGVSGSLDAFRAEGRVEDQHGPLTTYAEGKFSVGAEGSASATWGKDGFGAEADAFAGVKAHGEAGGDLGILHGDAQADAMAGGMAHGEAAVGKDGVHASGEAFAGAKATGSLNADVGGVGGSATGEAWAGVGISGDADVGFEDGKFTLGASGGAGLGVGGKVGFHVTVDVPKVTHTLGDAAVAVGDFFGL